MAEVKAVKVEPGSIVLLTGVNFTSPVDTMDQVLETIADRVGHTQFCLITDGREGADGDLEVWGPDVDLKAKIDRLLRRGEMR